jgi:NADPH:quinone reductase-like Zn-dependent oxidoreductase
VSNKKTDEFHILIVMNAIVYDKYGSPDVLQLKEVPKPTPGDHEVLIKVQALRGKPFFYPFSGAGVCSTRNIELISSMGNFVLVGFSFSLMLKIMLKGKIASKPEGKSMKVLMPKQDPKDLNTIKELLSTGKIKAVIDRSYPLLKVPDAIRYLEQGHARGKVAISVIP